MRHKGKLSDWNDDKGFGFISPANGGEQIFVHIKAFSDRQRRPTGFETLTYELGYDNKGRPRAEQVAITGKSILEALSQGRGFLLMASVALLLALWIGFFVTDGTPLALLSLYLFASLATFMAYALDKRAAQQERQRTPENTLHVLSLIGGWPGGLLAQKLLRHKSSKTSFQWVFWLTVVANSGLMAWLLDIPAYVM